MIREIGSVDLISELSGGSISSYTDDKNLEGGRQKEREKRSVDLSELLGGLISSYTDDKNHEGGDEDVVKKLEESFVASENTAQACITCSRHVIFPSTWYLLWFCPSNTPE